MKDLLFRMYLKSTNLVTVWLDENSINIGGNDLDTIINVAKDLLQSKLETTKFNDLDDILKLNYNCLAQVVNEKYSCDLSNYYYTYRHAIINESNELPDKDTVVALSILALGIYVNCLKKVDDSVDYIKEGEYIIGRFIKAFVVIFDYKFKVSDFVFCLGHYLYDVLLETDKTIADECRTEIWTILTK